MSKKTAPVQLIGSAKAVSRSIYINIIFLIFVVHISTSWKSISNFLAPASDASAPHGVGDMPSVAGGYIFMAKNKHYHKPQLAGASGHKWSLKAKKKYYIKRINSKLISTISEAISLIIKNNTNSDHLGDELIDGVVKILNKRDGTIWDDSMNLENEEWRPFPYQHQYLVSNKGRIRGLKSGRLLSSKKRTHFGHIIVSVCDNGSAYNIGAHNMVLMTFVGPRPSPIHVGMHLDNNPQNNELSNLKWGTPEDNMRQAYEEGRLVVPVAPHASGADHPNAIACYKYQGLYLIEEYPTIEQGAKSNNIPKTTFYRKLQSRELINGYLFTTQKMIE